MSPNRQPILNNTDQLKRFYITYRFSRHNFMLTPMTRLLLSKTILKKKPNIDITTLHINKFKDINIIHQKKSVI